MMQVLKTMTVVSQLYIDKIDGRQLFSITA